MISTRSAHAREAGTDRVPRLATSPFPANRPRPPLSAQAIAGICVYIGVDFLYDNLLAPLLSSPSPADLRDAAASWAVLALCLYKDMLYGVVLGVAAFQLRDALFGAPTAGRAAKSPAARATRTQPSRASKKQR